MGKFILNLKVPRGREDQDDKMSVDEESDPKNKKSTSCPTLKMRRKKTTKRRRRTRTRKVCTQLIMFVAVAETR